MTELYRLNGVGVSYGAIQALTGFTARFAAGEFVAIAGPNGAGKSTLLSVMAGMREHFDGTCLLSGKDVHQWGRKAFARKVSVVPQSVRIDFPFTAEQVVLMGRTAFVDTMFESDADAAHVERAMELTGTRPFRHRDFRTLSGGERQRVILASALAQTPEALLLDEPTTYLDLEHQLSLYKLLVKLSGEGVLVVTITHDLNLASTFASRIVLLRSGRTMADGPAESVIRRDTVREVFSVDAHIERGPTGRPWVSYGA